MGTGAGVMKAISSIISISTGAAAAQPAVTSVTSAVGPATALNLKLVGGAANISQEALMQAFTALLANAAVNGAGDENIRLDVKAEQTGPAAMCPASGGNVTSGSGAASSWGWDEWAAASRATSAGHTGPNADNPGRAPPVQPAQGDAHAPTYEARSYARPRAQPLGMHSSYGTQNWGDRSNVEHEHDLGRMGPT